MSTALTAFTEATTATEIATPLIYSKMAAILSDAEHIGKDRRNQQQGFQFRGIDDVFNSLHALFAKHKVFITTNCGAFEKLEKATKSGGSMTHIYAQITFKFYATDGSFVESHMVGEACDSGDKTMNKALSGALKYALLQAFLIPTEEQKDPDEESHEFTGKAAPKTPARATATVWRDVVIHFGKKKDTPLGKLDGESLSWWINNWQPKPYNGVIDGADLDLRAALDAAQEELASKSTDETSQPDPEENVDQEPITNWRDFVVTDLQFDGVLSKANGKKLGEIAEKGRAFIYEHFKPDISNINHVRLKKSLCLMHTETSSATAPH